MLFDLSEVLSQKDKIEQIKTDIEMDTFVCSLGKYPFVGSKSIEIKISNAGLEKVLVEGKLECSLEIPCNRCLEYVTNDFTIRVSKEISLGEEISEDDNFESIELVQDKKLDIDKLAYNEILVNLPMKVLCSENCKGICNRCGTNLNKDNCDCDTKELDPRMSKVLDIFNQFKEV